jgi:hypothetical protein
MPSLPTLVRLAAAVSALAGVVHLLVPDRLLWLARWGYDRVLAVRFQPREHATRRVRLLGVLFLAAVPFLSGLAAWLE